MVLNDSMLDLLNEKLGLAPNAPQKKKKHGPKVPAGKRITELPEKQNIAPKENEPGTSNDCRKRKAAKSNQLVKDTVSEESWECGLCVHAWDMQGDDVWIQCTRCDAPLQFPCCGLWCWNVIARQQAVIMKLVLLTKCSVFKEDAPSQEWAKDLHSHIFKVECENYG